MRKKEGLARQTNIHLPVIHLEQGITNIIKPCYVIAYATPINVDMDRQVTKNIAEQLSAKMCQFVV